MAPSPPAPKRRRRPPALLLLALLVLLVGGGAGAYFLLGRDPGTAIDPSSSATQSPSGTGASPSGGPSVTPTTLASPTPEPTPDAGDAFAFYEVAVGPVEYGLYSLDDGGAVSRLRAISFAAFSFARVEPIQGADGEIYWMTLNGDLTGFGYRFPDSGDFRVRAIFLDEAGSRRSFYLEQDELIVLPEATPAPVP